MKCFLKSYASSFVKETVSRGPPALSGSGSPLPQPDFTDKTMVGNGS